MSVMASQIISITIIYSAVYSGADHRKYQSSASLAFVTDEFPAQRASYAEYVPFEDVIMDISKYNFHIVSVLVQVTACMNEHAPPPHPRVARISIVVKPNCGMYILPI